MSESIGYPHCGMVSDGCYDYDEPPSVRDRVQCSCDCETCRPDDKPTGMHKDCPDEDGACYMGREADCPAFDKPTGPRLSPLLCIDCEKFYGEVAENDIINAVTAAHDHKTVCPKRDKSTGLTDEQIDRLWGAEFYRSFARRIEAIVRKDKAYLNRIGTTELAAVAEKARKDEREQAAGIADSYHEDSMIDTPTGIGAAIRRGE